MSVLFINCTGETFTPAHSGAICTWIFELCRAAEKMGHHPRVITRSSPHPQYRRPGNIHLDYPRLQWGRAMRKYFHLQQWLTDWAHPRHRPWFEKIADAIARNGLERMPMVLSNDPELAVWLRGRFPAAFIVHHAQNNNTSPPWFGARFGASVNIAAACSNFAARWNEAFFGLPAGRIKTLYNGVDVDAFVPRQQADAAVPLINFTGKTDPIKGPDILLMAADRLAGRTRNFAVQIVGRKFYDRDQEDDYQRELRRLADQLRDRGIAVRFTGWVGRDELPGVIGAGHIHVTPSRWDEPFGMTTIEAMACGMATIASRTGGTPEVIGDAGFLFEREDVATLAAQVERLVLDPDLRKKYADMARQRAMEFSWDRVWERLAAMIGI